MFIHTQINSCFGFVSQLPFRVRDVNRGERKDIAAEAEKGGQVA